MTPARHLLPQANEGLQIFGLLVAEARRDRNMTLDELAERVGVSHTTMRKVERGDGSVAIATAFEAAAILGVPLFSDDARLRQAERRRAQDRVALLRRVRRPVEIDNDF